MRYFKSLLGFKCKIVLIVNGVFFLFIFLVENVLGIKNRLGRFLCFFVL